MAGKIIADTIEHSSAGSVDTTYVVDGSAKAWVAELNSSAVASASFNFSSFTDNGTDNTATFTNAMTAEYAVAAVAEQPTLSSSRFAMIFARGASSFTIVTLDTSGRLQPSSFPHHAIVQGDLA